MLYFFNAILVLLELRKWAPVNDRVFERRENSAMEVCDIVSMKGRVAL